MGEGLKRAFAAVKATRVTKHTVYCDHCADPIGKKFIEYSHLPFNVDSANEGESGILCSKCDTELKAKNAKPEAPATPPPEEPKG